MQEKRTILEYSRPERTRWRWKTGGWIGLLAGLIAAAPIGTYAICAAAVPQQERGSWRWMFAAMGAGGGSMLLSLIALSISFSFVARKWAPPNLAHLGMLISAATLYYCAHLH